MSKATGRLRFAATIRTLGVSLALLTGSAAPAHGQNDLLPGRLPGDVRRALEPGMIATFVSTLDGAETSDARVARMAALYVPKGAAATPFLHPGPFRTVYHGYLRLKLKGEFVLGAVGNGRLSLWVNEELVLNAGEGDLSRTTPAAVSLVRGHNALRIEYDSPAAGDAWFRLHWAPPDTYAESIPPTLLSHDSREPSVRQGMLLRAGRALLAERRCLKCHRAGPDPLAVAGHMPELAADAPRLNRAGAKFKPSWMARWILDPRSLRTNATMPAVLAGLAEDDARQQAVDIAEFLSSLDLAAKPAAADTLEASAHDGQRLYETLGCVACHLVEPPEQEDLYDRTKHYFVGRKFQPGALKEFLLRPHADFAWSRMPDFRLSEGEASALAAFLSETATAEIEPVTAERRGDAQRGRVAFGRFGCANCHEFDDRHVVAKLPATDISAKSGGCLANVATQLGPAPDHGLTDDERSALAAFLDHEGESLTHSDPAETASRYVSQLRCIACHGRDEVYGYLPEIVLEEGTIGLPPEVVPHLTWAGEKLQGPWTERFIAGELPYRSRPWLKIRMPAFPGRAAALARGLAAQHGVAFAVEDPPDLDAAAVEIGRGLSLKDGGFHCVQCHGIGSTPAEGAFDSRGVNFSYVGHRLRHEYYLRWMANPLQYDPATKMPKFSPDGATTPLNHVYNGDAPRQFDALWHYLHSISK